MRTSINKKCLCICRKALIISIFIFAGFVLNHMYRQDELNAQTCTQIGTNNCRFLYPRFSDRCSANEYVGGTGYNTGDDMDDDDIWYWCCDFY